MHRRRIAVDVLILVSGGGAAERAWCPRSATAAIWLLVLATIVLLPDAFVRWFLPKDALAALAVVLASVAVARGRLPRWFVIAGSLAAGLALIGVLLSAAPVVQLFGRWPRYEGLVTLPVYFGAVWAGARLLGPGATDGAVRNVTRAVATAAIALGLVSVLEALGAGPLPSDLARPGSLTGNATDQGVLGAIFLAVLALPVLRAWTPARQPTRQAVTPLERAVLTVGLALSAASVVLSASRAGLLAAVAAVLVLLVLEALRSGRGAVLRTLLIGSGSVVLLAAAALAVPLTRSRLLGDSPLSMQSLEGRFAFWNQSLAVLRSHPFGVGVNGFLNANAAATTEEATLDSPHNWLFQVAMAGGLPLLVVVVGIVAVGAVVGLRAWRSAIGGAADAGRADVLAAALAALTGYGLALLTHFTAPSTTILTALLVGVLLAQAPSGGLRQGLAGSRAVVMRGIRSVILAAWAVWLVVVMSAGVPLADGVAATGRGDFARADSSFKTAQALRPWDADIASIAAQSFAAAADGGVPGAAEYAIAWAERSRAALPDTVATERALAVGLLMSGDAAGAERVLAQLAALAPEDASIAAQHAVALYVLGDRAGSEEEVARALAIDPSQPVALRLRAILAG